MVPISNEFPIKQTMIIKSRKTEEIAAEDIPCPCDVSSVLCTTGTNLPSRYSNVKVMVVSGAITPSNSQNKSEIEVCFNIMVLYFNSWFLPTDNF